MNWSLPALLDELSVSVSSDLQRARATLGHPTDLGDATEGIWIDLFNKYLPRRYHAIKATVVDSNGAFSDQIDVVIHDRQYTPLLFTFKDKHVVPAESVYAVFESKQDLNLKNLEYAKDKVASVRGLHRTSLPIPTIDGTKKAKALTPIIGGILTLGAKWSPALGDTLTGHLENGPAEERLDLGCVADEGSFWTNEAGVYLFDRRTKPVTRFLLELMSRLQTVATVPMIDLRAYAAKLD
ncbi:DUF6602 domain-containing protein [Maritimibacter sp. DP1N21-5]|uniref:DUF6602 domain-containing protein n=1 Tax=Maritimibacter sp. DP1N21-5 TaxID=2836867 RepID=UPI001C43FCDB|nr:DUF6602 domain-containing protein [Maritimibacter sp. DP1N21-5]MBV7408219.1 hypothetical protein [Maritimibacter sp. DP1N21-5]